MISQQEFKNIRKELIKFEENREKLIQSSREIIRLSKQIIYSLHRNNIKAARKYIKLINLKIKRLPKEQFETNICNVARAEYVEAVCYYEFLQNHKVPGPKKLKVSPEIYLIGLCDLTGELVRKAVALVMKKNYKEIEKIYEFVETLYNEFLMFDLRNGELRKKSDSIKWNLKKLEEVVLQLRLKK